MRSRLTTFLAAPILALLLAACSGPRLAKPDAGDAACHGKDPAAEARGTQGVSVAHPFNPYVGKDSYANVALDAGTVLYSLTPGAPPGFAVLEETLREAGGSQARYYALVQVSLEPGKDEQGRPRSLRDRLRASMSSSACAPHAAWRWPIRNSAAAAASSIMCRHPT